MKLPAHQYLEDLDIPYRELDFPPDTEKGAANVAHALGFKPRQMVKTLIFETAQGERSLVMLGGDQMARSGLLKKALGSRNIKMATSDVVYEITGYQVGSIPPFHWQPEGFKCFIESSLMEEEELGIGTGQWGREIILCPRDLARAANAAVVDLVPKKSAPKSGA